MPQFCERGSGAYNCYALLVLHLEGAFVCELPAYLLNSSVRTLLGRTASSQHATRWDLVASSPPLWTDRLLHARQAAGTTTFDGAARATFPQQRAEEG